MYLPKMIEKLETYKKEHHDKSLIDIYEYQVDHPASVLSQRDHQLITGELEDVLSSLQETNYIKSMKEIVSYVRHYKNHEIEQVQEHEDNCKFNLSCEKQYFHQYMVDMFTDVLGPWN